MPLETEKMYTNLDGAIGRGGWVTEGELRQNPQEWGEKEQVLSPSLASADDQWLTAKSLSPKVDQYCSAQSGPCSITKTNEVAYIPLLPQGTLGGSTETDTHGPMPQKACSSLSLSFFLSPSVSWKDTSIQDTSRSNRGIPNNNAGQMPSLLNVLSSLSLHQCI